MKKVITLLLTLCILASLCACKGNRDNEPVTTLTVNPKEVTGASPKETTEATETTETTQTTQTTETATTGTVEARRISSLACLEEYDNSTTEVSIQYNDENPLELSYYFEDLLMWQECYFPGGEQIRSETLYDPDGFVAETSEYDEAGNKITMTFSLEPGGETFQASFEYNELNLPTAIWIISETEEPFLVESCVYDDQGRVIEQINRASEWAAAHDAEAPDPEETIKPEVIREIWTYDEDGAATEYSEYTNDILTNHETWVYDQWGNVLENRSSYIYDEEGCEAYSIAINTYDENGNMIESFNEGDDPSNCWNYTSVYTYDEAGHLIEQVNTHADGDVVTDYWVYDENGNLLTCVTHFYMDGWFTCTTENTYNEDGVLIEELTKEECEYDPDYVNHVTDSFDEDSDLTEEIYEHYCYFNHIIYTYDEAGRLIEEIHKDQDAYISRTVYDYDSNDNIIQRTEYEGDDQIDLFKWTYNDNSELVDVGCSYVESLAALGDQVVTTDSGYAAVTYETVLVTEEEAQAIEKINEHILSSV